MGIFPTLPCGGFFRLLWRHQLHELRAAHLLQHAHRQGIGLTIVVNVNVHAVHHIEMGVREQFAHGGIAHFRRHLA